MKIVYMWRTFNFIQMLAALIPFKAKRYVMKWLKLTDAHITVSSQPCNSISIAVFRSTISITTDLIPSLYDLLPIFIYGKSFKDAWENALSMIAEAENMRNAEELCIWLDMKDAA